MAVAQFPSGFLWGVATAAYQVEGAHDADGKGESIWDRFCRTPGMVYGGHRGDVACDHYHRYKEAIALMRQLKLNAYRFSVSWPRIFPQGGGRPNRQGLDFYDRLVDALLASTIQPLATLYHWDLPQALQDRGGWANRDTGRYFVEYAGEVVRRLGDRVRLWVTHNEPWVIAFVGHEEARHAPGVRDPHIAIQVAHNVLVSHGEALPVIRDAGGRDARVGIVLNLGPAHPAAESDADRQAASRYDGYLNRWFLDAVFRGHYPEDMLEHYGKLAPQVEPGDMAVISRPMDFLGVNYYTRHVVRDFAAGGLPRTAEVRQRGAEYTEMGWQLYPQGLYEVLARVHKEYKPRELYVTENGIATPDALDAQGQVRDAQRISYTRDHLLQAHRAIREGVPLRGYFHWSLMDNFEWAHGYSKRFGMVYVDYATQKRTVKQSGAWYRDVIARNGVEYEA